MVLGGITLRDLAESVLPRLTVRCALIHVACLIRIYPLGVDPGIDGQSDQRTVRRRKFLGGGPAV